MRRKGFGRAVAVVVLVRLFHPEAAAQESIDHAMIAAIRAEALRRSEVQHLFYTLTDVIGPRLTGSPALGFYMQGNQAAKAIFDSWLEPLRDLGVRRNVIEGIGSTDHVPFDEVGLPGFTAIKDFRNYDVRTRHTNADLADAVNVEDLKQSAVVLAVVAWHVAMREERIPRRRQ